MREEVALGLGSLATAHNAPKAKPDPCLPLIPWPKATEAERAPQIFASRSASQKTTALSM
jgi:hypothetical protein